MLPPPCPTQGPLGRKQRVLWSFARIPRSPGWATGTAGPPGGYIRPYSPTPGADLKVGEAWGSPLGGLPLHHTQSHSRRTASHSLLGTLTQQGAPLLGPLPLRRSPAAPAPEHSYRHWASISLPAKCGQWCDCEG